MAGPSSSFRRVEWKYDARGRRIRQTSSVYTNGAWQVVEDLKLISDPGLFGRHVAELNATNNSLVRAYVWGLDLFETLDGAGGVGGLLWVRIASGPAAGTHFVCYDGNGNVWNLVSATSGTETARYEYGPFGEPLRLSGPAAKANPLRFSTKRTEDFTGLLLYEYRAYSPTLGRWLSRDPIMDLPIPLGMPQWRNQTLRKNGFYTFTCNRPVALSDALGLYEYEWKNPFNPGEKQGIQSSIERVKNRAQVLIQQIEKNIQDLSRLCPCAAYQKLINNLEHLEKVLEGMVREISDPDFNLEVYRGDLGPVEARYWDSPVPWYDDELILNNRWFGQPTDKQDGTMFHEISHGQGTSDGGDDSFNSAYNIEELISVDKEEWATYKNAKRLADRQCRR